MIAQQMVSGLAAGSLYALTALGLVLIFKNTDVVNFAQGDFGMIAAFVALMAISQFKVPFVLATLVAIVTTAILAVVVDRLTIRPMKNASMLSLMIATLGVYMILHGVAGAIWGRDTKAFPSPLPSDPVSVNGVVIGQGHLWILAFGFIISAVLFVFFRYTTAGLAMRATAEDRMAARLMGVNVSRIFALTWGVSGALAAVAGILLAPLVYLSPNMMSDVLVKAYAAAVLGGFGSLPGAIVGGLFIGVAENLAGEFISTELRTTFAFVLIVVVLAVRPTGVFGRRIQAKV